MITPNDMQKPEGSNIHHWDQTESGLNNEITSNDAIFYKNLSREEKERKRAKVFSICRSVVALLSLVANTIIVVLILHSNNARPLFRGSNNNPGNYAMQTRQGYYITQAQLLEHNTPADCWMALHGKVYDLTYYAKKHPGGNSIITDRCGSDATTAYDIFHSETLLLSINNGLIGYIVDVVSDKDEVFSAFDETNIPRTTRKSSSNKDINIIDFVVDNKSNGVVTMGELSNHNTADDCWVLVHGMVYDLTNYASTHPGGSKAITNLAGTDATAAFDVFHPVTFLPIIDGYKIGSIGSSGADSTTSSATTVPESVSDSTGSNEKIQILSTPTTTSSTTSSGMTLAPSLSSLACEIQRITLNDVRMHNTANDCWLAIHGNVYDLTDFVRRHPGGTPIITNLAGTDATSQFSRFHRESLLSRVQVNFVGVLSDTPGVDTIPCNPLSAVINPTSDASPGGSGYNLDSEDNDSDEDGSGSDED